VVLAAAHVTDLNWRPGSSSASAGTGEHACIQITDAVDADTRPDPITRVFKFDEVFYRLRPQ